MTRFPILRAAVSSPPTTLPLQPYFLAETAVDLLGLFERGTRRWRVAVKHLESTLQQGYIGAGLGTKPHRALSEEEVAAVEAQAAALAAEWAEVAGYLGDEQVIEPHRPGELAEALAVLDGVAVGPLSRPSALAG